MHYCVAVAAGVAGSNMAGHIVLAGRAKVHSSFLFPLLQHIPMLLLPRACESLEGLPQPQQPPHRCPAVTLASQKPCSSLCGLQCLSGISAEGCCAVASGRVSIAGQVSDSAVGV